LLTLKPLFPGKTEGSQLLEQIAILGRPRVDQLRSMSRQMEQDTINTIMRVDDMPKRDLKTIIPKYYFNERKGEAKKMCELIDKMLQWDPNQRCTAEKALQHSFFNTY